MVPLWCRYAEQSRRPGPHGRGRGGAPQRCAPASSDIQERARGDARLPARGRGGRPGRGRRAPAARPGPHRPALRHHRPATSSLDLDQALHLERDGDGYVVHYAIADVAAFVTPGDPVDVEANKRGETLYGADSKVPLHPKVLSEDAASLLPDQVRPALVWTIRMDAHGERTDVQVERALVRSTAKLSYDEVQRALDAGTAVGVAAAAQGDRRDPDRPGGRARRGVAAAARAGGRHRGRPAGAWSSASSCRSSGGTPRSRC